MNAAAAAVVSRRSKPGSRPFARRSTLVSSFQPQASSIRRLIGTPERLKTRATCRKQSIGDTSNRYRSRQRPRSPFAAHYSRITTYPLHVHAFLPETAFRVEPHVTYRKQTTGNPSTRDTSRPASPRARLLICLANLRELLIQTMNGKIAGYALYTKKHD